MDMAQHGMSKQVSSLPENKHAANEDRRAIRKRAEESNTMASGSAETMDKMVFSGEPSVYMPHKKTTLTSKVKATIKKVGKILQRAKPRKKRSMLHRPIVASTLKFHKDDDMDPADAGSAFRS